MENQGKTIRQLRKELADFSRLAYQRCLVSGTGGNMSVRIPDSGLVLVTPRGVSLGEVEPEANLLLDLDGKIIENPRGLVPSKESSFHLTVYRLRPGTNAIAHVHPPYATAYSTLGRPLPLVTVSSRVNLILVPCIDCALPGSPELCNLVAEGIKDHPETKALLMKDHGILTLGADLRTAFFLADLVEDTARVAFIAQNIKRPDA